MCSHPVSCVHANLAAATVQKPIVVSLDTTVQAAIAAMSGVRAQCSSDRGQSPDNTLHLEARSSCVVVVEQDRVVGILTERDVVRLSAQQHPLDQLPIAQVMTQPVITLRESDLIDLFTTINLLQQHRIRHVPIVDDQDCLIGLVTHESLRQLTRPVDLLRLRLVQEVMTSSVLCASPDSSMLEIARLMTERRVSSVVITVPGGSADAPFHRAVGLLTERDLVQFQALELNLPTTLAREVMSSPVFTITPTESLWTVQKVMEQQWIRRVIVAGEQGELLGIVTQTSLLQAFNPLELYNLAEVLEKKVTRLEAERISLLEIRAAELERQVVERTQTIQVQAERDRLMAGLSSQILASLDVQVILDTTVRQVRRILGCDRVNIWRFEAGWVTVVVAESTQSDLSLLGKRIADTCLQQTQFEIYRQGHIRVVPDIYATEMSDCHRDMLTQLQTRAKILVPLCCGDQLWGLLNVTEMQPRDWQPTEVEFLRSLSTQLAIALQQATRHQQLQDEIHDRQQTELELARLNAELEARVAKRTAELEAREARYRALMEGASDAILLTNTEGYFIEANQKAADLVGYDRHELVGMHFTQIHPPETLPTLMKAFEALINREHLGTLSLEFLRRDGQRIPVEATASVIDVGGETIAQAIFHDIRDRKRYEAALQESQQFLQTILDTVPISVFWKDRTSNYLGANQRFLQDAALSSVSELAGKSDLDLPWGATEGENYRADDRAVIESGKAKLGLVKTQYQQDGVIIWVEVNKLPLRNLAGDIIGVLGTYQDITERHNTEITLQRQLALIEAAVNGIAILQDGRYLYLNSSHATLFGYQTTEELIGQSWQVIYSPEELARFDQDILPVLYEQMSWQGEVIATRKDGTTFPEQLSLTIAADNLLICVCEDISDRKQAEDALRESEEKFRQLAEVVDAVFWILHLNRTDRVYISPAYERIWGRPCTELYVTPDAWVEMIHAEDQERVLAAIPKQIQGTFDEEYRIIRPDGTQRWIHDRAFPIRNAQGEVYRLAGIAEDITERKRSEKIIRQQAARETVLREISQRIRESLDLQTIFNTACEEIRTCLQADRVGIFKFYPDSGYNDGEFVAESVVNGFSSVVATRVHDHCFGENYSTLYAQGRYQVVDDIYHNGLTPCHADILAQFQVRANLVMPLLCNHELWGLLCIHQCDEPRHWHQSEIDLGQQLANQLAIAIQQAILYKQLQAELQERQRAEATITQQLRQQTALELILQQIRQSLNLPELLAIATQQVQELLGSDRVIVFQVCHDGHSQIVEEAVAPDLPRLKSMHWEDEIWSPEILEHYWQGQPRIVSDVMDDIWTDCLVDYSQTGQIQSKIVAPILQELCSTEEHRWVSSESNNKLWGVLVVHACHTQRIWHQDEAQLLQQIANQLAIAIQQSHLFEQLQQELTERQLTQQQLTERNQELLRATRLKDEFLANMSHELRTPLNAILGMSEGLQDDVFGPVNAEQVRALQTIERSGLHLLELINDILDVAKIEAGQVELDCQPTAIAHLCQSSLSFIKQQALNKRIQLSVNLPSNLPNIVLDERRIRQVLINLLNNAVKFTPEGGRITLEVSCWSRSQEGESQTYLRFSISDTGIGISPDDIQKLFQPFVQIDSALNRRYQGTGLGLALVKQIVDLHHGQVRLTSELGVGSCFTVDLPYLSASCDGSTIDPDPPDPCSIVHSSPLILLAEDNEANIRTIASYLRAKGYQLILARNGQEAIALAQSECPNIILMDIQMPEMDGLEAMQTIRRYPQLTEVPIIALTSLAMEGDRDRCIAAGANDYLSKPVKLKQLLMAIQNQLNLGKESS